MSRFAHHARIHAHDASLAHLDDRFIVVPILLWAAAVVVAVVSTLLQPPAVADTVQRPAPVDSIADSIVGA